MQSEFMDFEGHSQSASKEKFSVDVSAIESGGRQSKMQAERSRHVTQDGESKEQSPCRSQQEDQHESTLTLVENGVPKLRLKFNNPKKYESNMH